MSPCTTFTPTKLYIHEESHWKIQQPHSTMSDYVGSPTDEMVDGMANATIYEPDHELPEFVDSGSEIGSSVSVTDMNSNQVDGVLFDNAMQTIDTLKQEVY